MTTATLDPALSPRQRIDRANLVALLQEQVARISVLRGQLAAGEPVRGDLATELRELDLLQDRLDNRT